MNIKNIALMINAYTKSDKDKPNRPVIKKNTNEPSYKVVKFLKKKPNKSTNHTKPKIHMR